MSFYQIIYLNNKLNFEFTKGRIKALMINSKYYNNSTYRGYSTNKVRLRSILHFGPQLVGFYHLGVLQDYHITIWRLRFPQMVTSFSI